MRKFLALISCFGVLLSAPVVEAQISFVACGTPDSTFGAGTSGVNPAIPTNMDGDILVVYADRTDDLGDWNTPTGFTDITELNVTSTGNGDHESYAGYKIASSDSGTLAVTNTDTNSTGIGAVICAWRGVDQTTPLDATSTSADQFNTDDADPPSITTVTNGAVVVEIDWLRAYAQDYGGFTPSTGYAERLDSDATDFTIFVGDKTVATAGAEDPDAIDSGSSMGINDHIAGTMALRPASAGSGRKINPLTGPLAR